MRWPTRGPAPKAIVLANRDGGSVLTMPIDIAPSKPVIARTEIADRDPFYGNRKERDEI